MLRALAAALIAITSISAAHAAYYDLHDPVEGHPEVSYFDLVRNIVPDLQQVDLHGVGKTAIEVRYIEDLGEEDENPKPLPDFEIYSVEAMPIQVGGKPWMLMLTDLGPADGWAAHYQVLSLFDEDLTMRDAVNVGQDQLTGLDALVRVSATDEAVLTYSEHFNSNQTYGAYGWLMVRDGKFQTVDTFYILSDRWCGHLRTQQLSVSAEGAGDGYWPVTVSVADKLEIPAEDVADGCGEDADTEQPFETAYTANYSWSASLGQYITESTDFDRLSEINQVRY
jgi:hypothetical protein